jgi:uncharacterized phiE125 gp8 family phage protein
MTDYILSLLTPPASEPVTLAEALTQCHADVGVEDDWFTARISAGRQKVEDYIKRSLVTQTWVLRIEGTIPAVMDLPRSPVQELVSVTYQPDARSEGVEVDVDCITLINEGCPARIILPNGYGVGVLRVEYRAGYSVENLPQPLRDAILLYVSYSYENRAGESDIPKAFYNLIEPYRLWVWIDK